MGKIAGSIAAGLLIAAPVLAQEREIAVELPGEATVEFVWIEPGTLLMGSPVTELGFETDEQPQHEVTLSKGFYLGKYELTQAQWESVMATKPWEGKADVQENPNHPAVYISWEDVQEFIHQLNVAAGDSLYRLPTEAEWEYACRAGSTAKWSFGDDENLLKEYAWYRASAPSAGEIYAQAVGTKLTNPWGLYDMHGNVWEWVQDWYGEYNDSSQVDPRGPATGPWHVERGGYFNSIARDLRSALRGFPPPDGRAAGLGARLVRQGPSPSPTLINPESWGKIKINP